MTIERTPSLYIAPTYDFGLTPMKKFALYKQDPEAMVTNKRTGEYIAGSDVIIIRAVPNLDQTNITLRHETKHWTDDVEGLLLPDMETMLDEQDARHQSGKYGRTVLEFVDKYRYHISPHERRARRFAADRRITNMFGRIISYEPV